MDYRGTLIGYLSIIDHALAKVIGTDDEQDTLPPLIMAGVETLSLMADFGMLERGILTWLHSQQKKPGKIEQKLTFNGEVFRCIWGYEGDD